MIASQQNIAPDHPLPVGWIGYVRRHTALYKVVCLESDSFTEAGRRTARFRLRAKNRALGGLLSFAGSTKGISAISSTPYRHGTEWPGAIFSLGGPSQFTERLCWILSTLFRKIAGKLLSEPILDPSTCSRPGSEPESIAQVFMRQKDILFGSRSRSHIARQAQIHQIRYVIRELVRMLPEERKARQK
jgi:hypothetical protein